MSGAQQGGGQPLASTADNLTESVSTDDSVEGIARELAGMRNVVEENIPNDTDQYVYRADPLKLMNSGENDLVVFVEHDVGEERVGLERHDWMWNLMKRVAGGGFDFVVRADRKKRGIEPGTHESFMEIVEGRTRYGLTKLQEIHGDVRVISFPEPEGNCPLRIGDPRWNM